MRYLEEHLRLSNSKKPLGLFKEQQEVSVVSKGENGKRGHGAWGERGEKGFGFYLK